MIKVAILGAGFMGKTHLERYIKNDHCVVSIAYDMQLERAKSMLPGGAETVTDDIQKVWDSDVDMVDICLPTPLHYAHCLNAAKAGKHILCEKPMALREAECDEIIHTCNDANVQLMIAHVIRFWPEYRYLKQTVETGRLGKLLYIRSGRRQALPDWTFSNWMRDPAQSLGGVVDFQIHDLDFVADLLGFPEKVKSVGTRSTMGGWEQITTVMQHASGVVSCTEACNLMPKGYPFTASYFAVLEKGSIEYNCTRTPSLIVRVPDGEPEYPELGGGDGYQNEIDYFIQCLLKGERVSIGTGADGKQALKLALITKDSLDGGKEIVTE